MSLASPVKRLTPSEERIVEFKGLNRRPAADDGEMCDMKNLTSEAYPLLRPRPFRGTLNASKYIGSDMAQIKRVLQILIKYEKIVLLVEMKDGEVRLYIDGQQITSTEENPNYAVDNLSVDTRMVAINSKICFFSPPSTEAQYCSEVPKITAGGDITTEIECRHKPILETVEVTYDYNGTASGTPSKNNKLSYADNPNVFGVGSTDLRVKLDPSKNDVEFYVWKVTSVKYKYMPVSAVRKNAYIQLKRVGDNVTVTGSGYLDARFPDTEGAMMCEVLVRSGGIDIMTSSSDDWRNEAYGTVFNEGIPYYNMRKDDVVDIRGNLYLPKDEVKSPPAGADTKKIDGVTYINVGWQDVSCTITKSFNRARTLSEVNIMPYQFVHVIRVPLHTFIDFDTNGSKKGFIDFGTVPILGGRPGIYRESPVMDTFTILEYNNRLWGASSETNAIYACKLGDPLSWNYYQGTSLDSYYAEQGSDGNFTGAAGYSSHIMFFKRDSIAKVYGTAPSSYQITNTKCYGCMEGEHDSVQIVNDIVFYKSALGIMAYEGGSPYNTSEKFDCQFSNVITGTDGRKLYASIFNEDIQQAEFMCLDVEKQIWMKEDDNRWMVKPVSMHGQVYGVAEAMPQRIQVINLEETNRPLEAVARTWMAHFYFDEYIENRKIMSKLKLRLNKPIDDDPDAYVKISIRTDSGEWEQVAKYDNTIAINDGEVVPIVPRRCDHYEVKIEGRGMAEIKTLTRRYRIGTGGKL